MHGGQEIRTLWKRAALGRCRHYLLWEQSDILPKAVSRRGRKERPQGSQRKGAEAQDGEPVPTKWTTCGKSGFPSSNFGGFPQNGRCMMIFQQASRVSKCKMYAMLSVDR